MTAARAPVPLFAEPDPAHYEILAVRDHAAAIAVLPVTGFSVPARKGVPPVPFRLPFDWHADPLRDRNWMFNLQAWRMLDPYLHRLLREPEHPRGFADPLEILADWHRANLRGRAGRFTWYDMSTGLRALKLAFLGRLAALRGAELPSVFPELVERHMAELSRPEQLSRGNHGLFQMHGLRALAWQFPATQGAEAAAARALAEGAALLDSQLGPADVHTEHSPEYHFFAVALIGRLLAAPWWQGPETAPFRARLARARDAEPWLLDPAGRCLPVGDSAEVARVRDPATLARWPHRAAGGRIGAILDGYGVVRTAATPPECSTLLFLMASHRLEAHKHADCLSLIWQDRGEWLLVDPGKYGYQRDRMRRYFRSTRAHNTVELDGRDWSRAAADAYGAGMRRVEPSGAGWILEAEAPHRREGVTHRRLTVFRPHRFLLVLDWLDPGTGAAGWRRWLPTPGPRRHIAWWHFAAGHRVEAGGARIDGLGGGRSLAVSHVAGGAGHAVVAARGKGGLRPQGWISPGYGRAEPAPALGFASRARGSWRAATLFELVEAGARPALVLRRTEEGFLLDGPGELDSGLRRLDAFALDIAPGLL